LFSEGRKPLLQSLKEQMVSVTKQLPSCKTKNARVPVDLNQRAKTLDASKTEPAFAYYGK